jgi:hypothetical protein
MTAIDAKALLSEDVALPSTATTEYSTDEIFFGAGKDAFGTTLANPDIGMGEPVFLNIVMTAAGASSGSGTVAMNIVHGASTAPTTVLLQVCTGQTAAMLVAGKTFSVALPRPQMLAYMRLQVVTTTAGFESGTYTAWLSPVPASNV